MVDEVGMVIYIPLWYLLIRGQRIYNRLSALICIPLWYLLIGSQIRKRLAQLHNLHSTMVSINPIVNHVIALFEMHLHSTMVSINPDMLDIFSQLFSIYIPLWYLLIALRTQRKRGMYHLHSTMVSINRLLSSFCIRQTMSTGSFFDRHFRRSGLHIGCF